MTSRRGFTLSEILLAVGILLLLTGGAIAFSFPYLKRQQLDAAGNMLLAELHQAQTDAYAQVDDAGHGVKIFTDHLVRFEGPSYDARDASKDVTTPFPAPVDAVSGATEFDMPPGSLAPAAETTTQLQRNGSYFQITASAYGVLTAQEGTIAP